jgi:flagellin-like protein
MRKITAFKRSIRAISPVRKITAFKRSIRAISPVIATLLMIAIAVIASIVAYAWVTGYIGGQTTKAGNGIQLQSYSTQSNLVIYVQNTGQGLVHLKQDSSVYVNDNLKGIIRSDGKDVANGALIPLSVGQTIELTIDYVPQPNEQLRIKVVTVEGTTLTANGNPGGSSTGNPATGSSGTSGSPDYASISYVSSPSNGGSTSPSGDNHNYLVSFVQSITATANDGFTFSSWTFSGPVQVNNPTSAYTTISITGKGTGIITANFVQSSNPKLVYSAGTNQQINVNDLSSALTITRQDASGSTRTAGNLLVTLTVTGSSTGTFYADAAGKTPINSNPVTVTIVDGQSSIDTYYKDTAAGTPTIIASASGYSSVGATFTINSLTPTPTPTSTPTNGPTPTTNPTNGPTPTANPTNGPSPTANPTPTPIPGNAVQVTYSVAPSSAGTTSPSGTQTYSYGQTVTIQANANSGYSFSSWTRTGIIEITNPSSSTTTATMLSDGTITANYVQTSTNKLAYTTGTNQFLLKNVASSVITVQRQSSAGTALTSGTITINLSTTSTGGVFINSQGSQITSVTISNGQSTATFFYKDSTTGTPTITASATSFASVQTTFSINLCYSNFDGANWLLGWTTGSQPPWYQSAVGEGVDATNAAKSDSTNYLGGNDGPFTCSVLDTSVGNTITIKFMYKVLNTDSANDLRLAWTNVANPNLGMNSADFHYVAAIGLPGNSGWNSYTLTFTRSATPDAFTTHFMFRFESNLQTHQGSGLVESTFADNVSIMET